MIVKEVHVQKTRAVDRLAEACGKKASFPIFFFFFFFMGNVLFHGAPLVLGPGSTYLVVPPLSKALQKTLSLYLSEINAFRPTS